MTNRQLETSREIRQWVKTIATIAGGAIYVDWRYPELKERAANWFKSKFEKGEKSPQ